MSMSPCCFCLDALAYARRACSNGGSRVRSWRLSRVSAGSSWPSSICSAASSLHAARTRTPGSPSAATTFIAWSAFPLSRSLRARAAPTSWSPGVFASAAFSAAASPLAISCARSGLAWCRFAAAICAVAPFSAGVTEGWRDACPCSASIAGVSSAHTDGPSPSFATSASAAFTASGCPPTAAYARIASSGQSFAPRWASFVWTAPRASFSAAFWLVGATFSPALSRSSAPSRSPSAIALPRVSRAWDNRSPAARPREPTGSVRNRFAAFSSTLASAPSPTSSRTMASAASAPLGEPAKSRASRA